ncbi:MAG: terminase small subunit [Deltaproteobacteria bacterium]|nr:terminase small subunit [Deltaproteobacteria bacterium]
MAKTSQKKKKIGKKPSITPRIRKFIDIYIETDNATQSYIRAGYSENGADRGASRLLRNVEVSKEIEQRRKELREKADVRAEDLVNELRKIAFANAEDYFKWGEVEVDNSEGKKELVGKILLKRDHEVCRDKKAAIAAFKETNIGFEIKFHDKLKAIDSLARYLGLFNEAEVSKARQIKKAEDAGPKTDPTEGMTREEVEAKIVKLQQ